MTEAPETPAATEDVVVETAVFKGETFALNPDVSDYAVIEFATAVNEGLDTSSYAGLAALNRLVLECIAEDDRTRFRAVARRTKADAEDLFEFLMSEKVEVDAERPTVPSSDSSDGRESTAPKSDASSDGSTSRFSGRPDLLIMLDEAREQRRSA